MLEGIVSDGLVRLLGSYVDGLSRESIRLGVWRGDLELKNLRLRPDALAVLFETLGLDLPVTVTAGYIGLLRLEVPWKRLRSAPVRIFMHDVTVVASPVSDGDQSALEFRDKRLKAARLATDEAIRDAKFSVRSMTINQAKESNLYQSESVGDPVSGTQSTTQQTGNRITRWGWRFTSKFVTKIVDNIQIDVENVIVQYEDASSVRDRPYTATLAFDSLRACSTNFKWLPVFIESPDSPVVHKVVYMKGLVLNWAPGNAVNELKDWILHRESYGEGKDWLGFVRNASRHAIRPMDGELRIALTKSSALAAALAGTDENLMGLRSIPRVQMDLHFPDVKIALDDFQYHTLLSTIMYLSDIDRKVRPKTARGRWFWALERLLPRFRERRDAALRFNAEGMKQFRETREEYCRVRNAVVNARRNGAPEPIEDTERLQELELALPYKDIVLFRDIADSELYTSLERTRQQSATTSRFWSFFSRSSQPAETPSTEKTEDTLSENNSAVQDQTSERQDTIQVEVQHDVFDAVGDNNAVGTSPSRENSVLTGESSQSSSSSLSCQVFDASEIVIPNFRMGFLLGRGCIQLKRGGFPTEPVPFSNLEFRELRLGIETRPGAGLLLEALLGTFEVIDLEKNARIMYPRVPWAGSNVRTEGQTKYSDRGSTDLILSMDALPNESSTMEMENTYESTPSDSRALFCAVLNSYPHAIADAIFAIRGEYGLGLNLSQADPDDYVEGLQYNTRSFIDGVGIQSFNNLGDSEYMLNNMEEPFQLRQTPLKYIAALKLNQEEVLDGDWAQGSTRMAMDLAIGGMEVLLDGPQGAFISSVMFWHPREKMPSIMQFLAKSAAPRLASLRMDIQRAILERSVPMRMDILIRGPRFVMPARKARNVSLVLDLGTFAMETSTGPSEDIIVEHTDHNSVVENVDATSQPVSIRYTDYRMACTDLGLYVMPKASMKGSERIITPFSVHLLLQVMHNSSFVDVMAVSHGPLNAAKVKLQGELPSLKISVSHEGFRNILRVAKGWGHDSEPGLPASGIEPNRATHSLSMPSELEEIRHSQHLQSQDCGVQENKSRLITFSMNLDFEDLQLELKDSMARRIVTISSSGTHVKLVKRPEVDDFDFRVHRFTVIDGSRGATAPFRRIAYAGVDEIDRRSINATECSQYDVLACNDDQAFISLSYRGDVVNHEQSLAVRILSLHLVCVRETYFALADFFYLSESQAQSNNLEEFPEDGKRSSMDWKTSSASLPSNRDEQNEPIKDEAGENGYSDPFAALGMTTSEAARAIRDQAGRGMEISKQALADRGQLSVNAELDGLIVTLVTAEGAIACFDVSDCKTELTQCANGAIEASGELGGFGVRDLTSAFDVYSETIRYNRSFTASVDQGLCPKSDGWSLKVPDSSSDDIWLEAHLRNIRIVYLHRFIVILKKYFDVLRESLKPVLEMKGGIAEMFDEDVGEDFPVTPSTEGRIRVRIHTEEIDLVMPRHSQSPYEALRFFVSHSSITNDNLCAPGYQIGFEIMAEGVNAHVLYQPPGEGEGRALTEGGTEPVLKQITPNCPIADLLPFSENIWIVAKLDTWRRRRVPEVILNADGIPVLKDGQKEREYDPGKWLPSIRVRVSAPNGISARLCEAEYSILYFTFTENIIERPDIEFTDIVRGLKTPILPTRKPVQPIMFSSNRMPPNYQILFEVPLIESVIMSGADGKDDLSRLIRTELRDLVGSFEYGVDYRMTIDVSANMSSLQDARPYSNTNGMTLIMPTYGPSPDHLLSPHAGNPTKQESTSAMARSVTLTWDRPFGFRANVMVVASDLRIIVEPELFRDLGALTAPGFPFLKSSAPPPLLRFNGRLLIVTVSRPEIWLMANQYPGDGRSLVIRGDVIAKVLWAPVTGRNTVEVAAHGVQINLSSLGPQMKTSLEGRSSQILGYPSVAERKETETPMLYSCDVSMKFEGRGYDPPQNPGDEPRKAPGSSLSVNAESFLVRIDVNDASLILAVGSRLVRLKPSKLSQRPEQPGRFDQWIDKGDEGDAKLSVHFALPHCRLMFTDETLGRYVPIMEARLRNGILKSNVPWLTNAALEFALDLFNEEKGWWEPGIESFPVEFASSKGRSGSMAIHVRAERNIDVNVTPNTVSGAARVSKALKSAIEELGARLKLEDENPHIVKTHFPEPPMYSGQSTNSGAKRPSVAAFCVRNETGRPMQMWLPYDSKRRALRGNGGEIEVDTPSEEILWTAIGATGGLSPDPSMNRQLSMSCILSLSGYEALTLSTEQTGIRLIKLIPDTRDMATPAGGFRSLPSVLTLIWAVSMRDGVPCGCIRSAVRIVNRTKRLLEVNIGGMRKSQSDGNNVALSQLSGDQELVRDCHRRVKPGDAWAIPIYAIHRMIRIRPYLIHALESESNADEEKLDDVQVTNSRLRYEFLWSDPLSNLPSLYEIANETLSAQTAAIPPTASRSTASSTLVLKCEGAGSGKVFCLVVHPVVDAAVAEQNKTRDGVLGSIDVQFCTPLVIENLLPRSVFLKLALPGDSRRIGLDQVIEGKHIDPLAEAHIHGVGSDHSSLAAALGMDNSLDRKNRPISNNVQVLPSRQTGDFHPNFLSLNAISTGSGRYMPFKVKMEHDQEACFKRLRLYCQYWIRNRSDTDLFFRDREHVRGRSMANPKVFLKGCPPGRVADKYVCFSGNWIAFQRADATEDIWVHLSTEIAEVDKPMPINLEGRSLVVDVRPALGKFQRTLVVTIRNSMWLQNHTGTMVQWCQPEALNPHGIALASKVHAVGAGDHIAVHWDFRSQKKSLCFRRANEDSSSDWMWSRPVFVEGVQGEFPTKMYRPKRHEQYIARVVISKLGNGVSAIVVNREDRNTPPYRIVNHCVSRSIAFRQSGVNETRLWLVRPGRSTRYAWDDPQAPIKRRSLVVEVIEPPRMESNHLGSRSASQQSLGVQTMGLDEDVEPRQALDRKKSREIRYPKFDLNIDMIRADVPFRKGRKFVPDLKVSVHVEGPTKVVTFSDQHSFGNVSMDTNKNGREMQIENKKGQRSISTPLCESVSRANLDVELFVKAIGISFVDASPIELAYLSVSGIHFRLDRFDGQQLIVCDIQDLQLDNQLEQCTWPVVLWSPPPPEDKSIPVRDFGSSRPVNAVRKPFFQFTVNGPYPPKSRSIGTFNGVFVALQQMELAADEDFVLRVWLFVTSLIEAVGGANTNRESLYGLDGLESGIPFFLNSSGSVPEKGAGKPGSAKSHLSRIYVEKLELCPIKLSVSFTSSRTSKVAEQIGGFRSLIRTLVAVLGNVENAEFRFNALELHQVCDTTAHFRSLIVEFYISQGSNQKMVLLASNSLIGNPSALFDSIAIGARDFFVEPANAKGSADFIASIGRGSSSLLTNTVGGLVGSLGEIPRAVAQGLETAVGDRDYLAERDSIRGGRARVASSPAQGLFTGALSFGHGIASGAAGLFKDPIQGAAEEGPSGFIKGLGKGFIGGVLKPITGALDLIAEPAAGFRSMMVSERSSKAAEPIRPPRAFSGPHRDQMVSYNLRSALGEAILHAVNRNESLATEESLMSWTYLVAVHASATPDDVVSFLWHLLRRSTRSTHHTKHLMDAEGNPQKAEKLRAGLVTTKRLIITSLDGHILWEHPLVDIIEFHVLLEQRDDLMIGVRPAGTKTLIAPTWKRLRCGSMVARDELNASLRKAMEELKTEPDFIQRHQEVLGDSDRDDIALREIRREHRRDKSVEMVDMTFIENDEENMYELKRLHHDASNDGRRGIFTDMKLPGRDSDSEDHVKSEDDNSILKLINKITNTASSRHPKAVRSIRMVFVNYTFTSLRLISASLQSGQWVEEPPQSILPRSVASLEVDGTINRVIDISGRVSYQFGNDQHAHMALRFLNPLLAPNAYSIECSAEYTITQTGGERGDHVTTILSIRKLGKGDKSQREIGTTRATSSSAEPLLFGRSKVSPHLPPITFQPPHVASSTRPNPNDPSKIAQLASLGFSENEAKVALQENEANLSKAYSALVDGKHVD